MRWGWILAIAVSGSLPTVLSERNAKIFAQEILATDQFGVVFEAESLPITQALELLHREPLSKPVLTNSTTKWDNAGQYEIFRATEAESYLCKIPTEEDIMAKRDHKEKVRLTQADADAILQRGLTILDTLSDFEIRHRIGYFSHILRYGKHFLQMPNYILEYRESSGLSAPLFDDASNIPKDHYFLGRWPKSKGMESNPQNSILVPMLAKPSTETHDGNDDLYSSDVFYIQQIWADGTICDLNEKPRTTTIKYYCGSHTAIELLTEVQTCEYTAIVSVEALCDEPYFHLPDIKPVNEVNCRLIVPDEEKEQEAYTEYVKKLQKDMLNAHEHVDEQYYQYPPEKDNFDVLDDAALNFELDKDPALTPEVPAKEETIDDKDLDQILFELFVKATVNPDMRDSRVDEEEGDVSRDTEVNDQALHDLYDL